MNTFKCCILLGGMALAAAYTPEPSLPSLTTTRREWFVTTSAALLATSSGRMGVLPANAAATTTTKKNAIQLTPFDDPTRGFSINVPSEWTFSKQILRDRRELFLWQDPGDGSTALSIAYTPIRDDFTSLASFGTVDQVAAQTIMPKGALAGNEDDAFAKMLSATSAKQAYLFDYRQTVPLTADNNSGVPTHFRVIFALQQGATGGAGSILVTITAQTPEARYPMLQPSFDAIVDSFGKSKTAV